MIAAACVRSRLDPRAFGVDEADVVTIGQEIVAILEEQDARDREDALMARARRELD